MKTISLLGSTGSIGVNTLDLVERYPERFQICALAAGVNIELLKRQIERFRPGAVAVIDEAHARGLADLPASVRPADILFGKEGYEAIAAHPEADLVVSAQTGAVGLLPTYAALKAGKDVALANKEALVMAGGLIMKEAGRRGAKILPVDSEHSAIFQCLQGQRGNSLKRVILTASGGPFFNLEKGALQAVKPEDALRHPNWKMGRKITVDSATMMNKGLEVIEAGWLFDLVMSKIAVVVHPPSVIHSLVEFVDGSILAQLGVADMRIPIAYALSYPERLFGAGPELDLLRAGPLEFIPPDVEKFPSLRLAREAAIAGGTMPAVLNAANEGAVEAFISGRIGFMEIPEIIERVMDKHLPKGAANLEEILEADRWARGEAGRLAGGEATKRRGN